MTGHELLKELSKLSDSELDEKVVVRKHNCYGRTYYGTPVNIEFNSLCTSNNGPYYFNSWLDNHDRVKVLVIE